MRLVSRYQFLSSKQLAYATKQNQRVHLVSYMPNPLASLAPPLIYRFYLDLSIWSRRAVLHPLKAVILAHC